MGSGIVTDRKTSAIRDGEDGGARDILQGGRKKHKTIGIDAKKMIAVNQERERDVDAMQDC
jgi:hypothetical protein